MNHRDHPTLLADARLNALTNVQLLPHVLREERIGPRALAVWLPRAEDADGPHDWERVLTVHPTTIAVEDLTVFQAAIEQVREVAPSFRRRLLARWRKRKQRASVPFRIMARDRCFRVAAMRCWLLAAALRSLPPCCSVIGL